MRRRKVLLVGIDGLRVDDALRGGAAPALCDLVGRGTLSQMTMEVPTVSGPGWSSLLTGSRHAEHGVRDNTFTGHTLHRTPDVLTRAGSADASCTTFAAVGWPPLGDPAGPGPVIRARPDDQRDGRHHVLVRDGEARGYRWADAQVAATSVEAIGERGPDAAFVYLGEVDEAGHQHGGASGEYSAAVGRVDAHLGALLAAVAQRGEEDWLVAVTTDHGHLDQGGHGGGEDVVTRSFLALARYCGGEVGSGGVDGRTRARPEVEPHGVAAVLLAHLAGSPAGGRPRQGATVAGG